MLKRALGRILLQDFCPRCFWFTEKFRLVQEHPYYSPPPRVVSIGDKYIKRVVRVHLTKNKNLPGWLFTQLNNSYFTFSFKNIKHIKTRKWRAHLFDNCCILSGEADEIFEFPNGKWFIVDYKLTPFLNAQQNLLPKYEAQLNAYAYLAQKLDKKEIAGLALIYFEPQYKWDEIKDEQILNFTEEQFIWSFKCTVVPIKFKGLEWIELLCKQVYQILSKEKPPEGKSNCKGCESLNKWYNEIKKYL